MDIDHMTSQPDQIALAQLHKDAGRLDVSANICHQVLSAKPSDGAALHLLGAIFHLKGKQEEAIHHLELAAAAEPANATYLVTLGGNLAIAGQLDAALSRFQAATTCDPKLAAAHYNLGLALKHFRRFEEAIASFETALSISTGYVDAQANLAFCLLQLGKIDEASGRALLALERTPNHALATTVIAATNATATGLHQLGSSYLAAGQQKLAKACFRFLVSRFPATVDVLSALALLESYDLEMVEALATARKAVAKDPASAGAHMTLGQVCAMLGLYDEAYEALDRSNSIRPLLGARVRRDLLLPAIMGTVEEVDASRRIFDANLDTMGREGLHTADPYLEMGFVFFYLAFHAKNDTALLRKLARFFETTAPSLRYVASHVSTTAPAVRGAKRRVGFYSKFVYTHSVSMCFGKVVNAIQSSGDLEVILISPKQCDPLTASTMYSSLADGLVQISEELDAARTKIAALELDALVYLDIGMDPFSYQLAFSRLAKVQCVMAGHPSTTGIPAIDYFLSTADIEPLDAQKHYTEKLVRLDHGTTHFFKPDLPATWKGREDLGLPMQGNLYFCPVMLQKIHPDFDAAVEQILLSDPEGRVVFVESGFAPPWADILRRRFDRNISSAVRDRVVFVPWFNSTADFLAALRASNVILDPFHFGIGTTTLHLSAVGTPFVTMPGEFSRGRCGYALAKTLEIDDCIALSASDYVAKAVGIATSPALRSEIHLKIMSNSSRVFGDKGAAKALASKLLELIEQPSDQENKSCPQ